MRWSALRFAGMALLSCVLISSSFYIAACPLACAISSAGSSVPKINVHVGPAHAVHRRGRGGASAFQALRMDDACTGMSLFAMIEPLARSAVDQGVSGMSLLPAPQAVVRVDFRRNAVCTGQSPSPSPAPFKSAVLLRI